MSTLSVFSRRSLAIGFGLAFALAASCGRTSASAENQIDGAISFSQSWVSQIDAGKYDDSYALGCEAMKKRVDEDRWDLVLKSIRSAWGSVVSRKQVSHVYKPNGISGLEGECVVITYDTAFKKLNSATEIVVLKWEDGKWLGAGYNAAPKTTPEDQAAPPTQSPTEIHTEEHTANPPQSQ